jgi:F-type H+-transporting ATPase subunit b
MSKTRRLRQTASVCLMSLVLILFAGAISARAAEEGTNAATEHFSEIFRWVNFAIVAAVVIWVFAKRLPPVFRRNAESIRSAITRATAAKAEADRLLREAETKLANLQKQVAALREEAQREAAAEVERIRAATQSDEQKIAAAAKGEIEAAERAARMELKELAAKLAVDGAETLLVRQLTAAVQESLISGFVKTLEGRPN